jgi:quinol monooxygenase YgiN
MPCVGIDRRTFNLATLAASAVVFTDIAAAESRSKKMYGLISQLITKPEHRQELVEILAGATKGMVGCLSYVIALDATRDDAVWITEVWHDSESHAASLKLPKIQAAMTRGRPLITGMGLRATTSPIAGA